MVQTNKTTLQFPNTEEEIYIFQIEDLFKEYNHKVMISSLITRQNSLNLNSLHPSIGPVEEDITWGPHEVKGGEILHNALKKQIKPEGIAKNTKYIAKLATIAGMIDQIGLRGQVYYKTVKGKTYVILKGNPAQRHVLKGTRYLNTNPQITQLGLGKVNFKSTFVKGYKMSFWVYGGLKAIEAVKLIIEDGKLQPRFFSEAGTAIPKIALSSLFTAAVATGIAATAMPVAVGAGIVLMAGFAFGIAVECFDQQIGLTKRLNEAADKMWENLKKDQNISTKNQNKSGVICNPLLGLPCGVPYAYKKMIEKDNQVIYTA